MQRLGAIPGANPSAWHFERDPARAVEGADFVQESAPERDDVKKALLPRPDAALPPEVVIASSSSGLLVSRLAQGCRHPGLRWALMGPRATFHLAGGEGGMTHFLHHLLPAMQAWWQDLGTPAVTPSLQKTLVEGVRAEVGGRSVADLAARRDAFLVDLLELRRRS